MILLLLLTSFAFAAKPEPLFPDELSCREEGQLRFVDQGKSSEQSASYCFSDDHSYFLSASCRDHKCLALTTDLSGVQKSVMAGKVGSPGFKLCRSVGGTPELLEYFDGLRWRAMDRCLFAKDASFVDTGILLRRWARDRAP